MIPYGRQSIDDEDCRLVSRALKDDFLTTGPAVKRFETAFAKYVNAKYAVAVSNGTAALHLAYLAAGLKKGDEIITTPMTFCATSNAALYCNAKPVFADIKDDDSGLIDPKAIIDKISSKTRIIAPVHYAGQPADMEKIKEIADEHNLIVVEDASHALGAKYNKSKIGDCAYSDMCTFSFHPVKHITTGEGGMVTTNSKKLYEKLLMLRNHGLVHDKNKLQEKDKEPWYHELQYLGYNYRLTDFQSILGMNQLKRSDRFLKKRKDIAQRYDNAFKHNDKIKILKSFDDRTNSYHLYVVILETPKMRLGLFKHLGEKGINCQVHYIPVHLHPHYKELGYRKGMTNAESFYERILSIPIYQDLKDSEQEKAINEIEKYLK